MSRRVYYGAPGATVERIQDSAPNTADVQTILQDNLGSSSVVVTDATSVVKSNRYSVWGETRDPTSLPTDLGYTGQEKVSNFPIMYYNARWYDPTLGRFLQPDSMIPNQYNPVDFDLYAYVNNNPVNRVDPSGHADAVPDSASCSDDNCRMQANVYAIFAFESRHNNSWVQIVIPKTTIEAEQIVPTTMGPNPSGSLVSPKLCEYTPSNPSTPLTNENVGDTIELVGNALDIGEGAFHKSIPGLGLALPVYAQAIKDFGKGYNDKQLLVHGAIVAGESAATSLFITAFGATAIYVFSGPPGWFVGGVTTVVVVITADKTFNQLNEKVWFPQVDKQLK
jgi:RHS repeat-associated protein